MSAQPPEGAGSSQRQPHQYRSAAESFGVDPERYDRTRQPYPTAMIDRIVTSSSGRDVLDVGCGTGIAARQFQAAGCRVLGVEPDARMAEFARGTGVDVDIVTFEAWDPAGRTFDAVVAGTAWHWVDPVVGAAKAAKVLRPNGRLAPFHHIAETPLELRTALAEAYRRVAPDSPFNLSDSQLMQSPLDLFQPVFTGIADAIRAEGGLSEPEQWRFDWSCTYTRDEYLDQLPTSGNLTLFAPGKLAEILTAVGTAIDAMGGIFTMPYATVVVTATRLP